MQNVNKAMRAGDTSHRTARAHSTCLQLRCWENPKVTSSVPLSVCNSCDFCHCGQHADRQTPTETDTIWPAFKKISELMATKTTSSSAMAQRPRELSDFKAVGHFEAKFQVEGLCFAPMTVREMVMWSSNTSLSAVLTVTDCTVDSACRLHYHQCAVLTASWLHRGQCVSSTLPSVCCTNRVWLHRGQCVSSTFLPCSIFIIISLKWTSKLQTQHTAHHLSLLTNELQQR